MVTHITVITTNKQDSSATRHLFEKGLDASFLVEGTDEVGGGSEEHADFVID